MVFMFSHTIFIPNSHKALHFIFLHFHRDREVRVGVTDVKATAC